MQIRVSLAISDGYGKSELSLLTLDVDAQPSIETLGLGLADSKALRARLQDQIVTRQVQSLSTAERRCEVCGSNRSIKDYHDVQYRSLFGSVVVKVPRWRKLRVHRCPPPTKKQALDLGGTRVRAKPLGRNDPLRQIVGAA